MEHIQTITITKNSAVVTTNMQSKDLCELGMYVAKSMNLTIDQIFDANYDKDETLVIEFSVDDEQEVITFHTLLSKTEVLLFIKTLLLSYYHELDVKGEQDETQ